MAPPAAEGERAPPAAARASASAAPFTRCWSTRRGAAGSTPPPTWPAAPSTRRDWSRPGSWSQPRSSRSAAGPARSCAPSWAPAAPAIRPELPLLLELGGAHDPRLDRPDGRAGERSTDRDRLQDGPAGWRHARRARRPLRDPAPALRPRRLRGDRRRLGPGRLRLPRAARGPGRSPSSAATELHAGPRRARAAGGRDRRRALRGHRRARLAALPRLPGAAAALQRPGARAGGRPAA